MARKGRRGRVKNPMNTRSNRQLLFGHSLTHSRNYQKSVGSASAKREHDRLVKIMKKRSMKHASPYRSNTRGAKR